ncbi:MAG: hypothetical protein AAGL98_02310 [Planctomycetota bacterium]
MTRRSLTVLIVLNVILLGGLSLTVMNPTPAEAQFGGGRQFTMIAGQTTGRSSQAVIYIVDLNSSKVAPIFYNGNNKKFEFFGGRTISDDFEELGRSR